MREIDKPMVQSDFEGQHAPLARLGKLVEEMRMSGIDDLGPELKPKALTLLLRVGRQTKHQEDEEKERARCGVMERLARVWIGLQDEKRAAAALASGGKEKAAAALLKESGDWESRVQLYEALGDHQKAAQTLEGHGMKAEAAAAFGLAKDVRNQLRLLAELSDQPQIIGLLGQLPKAEAGKLAIRYEVLDAWAQLLTEQEDWLALAELYAAHGQLQIAAQAYEKAEHFQEAYEAYAKAGEAAGMDRCLERVVEAKVEANDTLGAAQALVKVGRLEKAAELSAEKHPERAHRWYLQGGYTDKALELARHEARKAEGHSDFQARANWLGLAGDHLSAATLWEGLGKTKKALDHYEKAKAWEPAARVAEGLGKADEAVDFYYRAGLRDEAERVKLHGPGGGVAPVVAKEAAGSEAAAPPPTAKVSKSAKKSATKVVSAEAEDDSAAAAIPGEAEPSKAS